VALASGSVTLTIGFFQPPTQWALELTWGAGYYAALGPLQALGTPSPSGEQRYTATVTGLQPHTTYALAGHTALFVSPSRGFVCPDSMIEFTFGTFTTQ
jgi:hypothetical protein